MKISETSAVHWHFGVPSRTLPGSMTAGGALVRYRFGPFELQPDERRLLASGIPVALGRHALDVLIALTERGGQLVTKDQLLKGVWGQTVVEENTLSVHIYTLRKVLGRDSIATVPRHGYRFMLKVDPVVTEAPRRDATPQHNLPHDLTSFIGRDQEMADLRRLLGSTRLLTLIGSGGCGKTRLAIRLAREEAHRYPDGVWLVELAALADAALLPQTVAGVLGLKEKPAEKFVEAIANDLAAKSVLIVLDNAEHLIAACAELVDSLLRRCARLVILVTSRERLNIMGELTYRVPSLTVPAAEIDSTPESIATSESARLLIERARFQVHHFEVTPQNSPAIAAICRRLDGIALAIELAAPRLRSMSVEELSSRLDECLGLLTEGSRTALPRHRTLRSVIDWSYDLLTGAEQAMLRRLAVFAGGWTLASAKQVCVGDTVDASDVMALLTSLIDKSLVVTDNQSGATRYRMLETVRQYARDRLRDSGEQARWRGRHLACFVALADEFFDQMKGPKQQAWLTLIAGEHDNLRTALAWSLESHTIDGLRLAAALNYFWIIRGLLGEGREWLTRLLDAFPIEAPKRDRARGLYSVATIAIRQGDYAAGKRLLQDSLAISREAGDSTRVAFALDALTYLSIEQGLYPEAEVLARESADCARVKGDRWGLFSSLGNLAIALHRQGQWSAARELYEQSVGIARELGPWETAAALNEFALAESAEGCLDLALKHFAEGMTILHGLGDRGTVIESLEGLAGIAAATAAPRRAARLWGAAHALRQETGNARSVHLSIDYERQVKAVRAILTAQAFNETWHEGQAMSLDDVVRYALDDQTGREA